MTLKPPTRTFPKLVMKEWPERTLQQLGEQEAAAGFPSLVGMITPKALSDFTRVVDETGILKKP